MTYIDSFLNGITMYRLLLWGLTILAVISILFGFLGFIAYSGLSLIELLVVVIASCALTDFALTKLLHSAPSIESTYITGFILFFIMAPIMVTTDVWAGIIAGVTASLSKYVFAIHKRHIFNPAATGAFLVGFTSFGVVSWWVATPNLFPFILVLGLLIVRKLRRFDLFLSFFVVSTCTTMLLALSSGSNPFNTLLQHLFSWPIIFFGCIMLTEPYTTPPSRLKRLVYGALVGIIFAIPFHVGTLYSSPQLALILGCVFSYLVSSKQRILLTLKEQRQLSASVQEFIFTPNPKPVFAPGQYMEWTLPHAKPDSRGNRRFFTIASAKEDDTVRLGVRIGENSSTFKKTLRALAPGSTLVGTSIAGEFTLPSNPSIPLLCIAGGVGITPYVSYMRHLIDTGEHRDMVLVYATATKEDVAYSDLCAQAQSVGVKTIVLMGAFITKEWLQSNVPDYMNRYVYLSGPQGMVTTYKKLARSLSIPYWKIKTDYFPGL